MDNSVLSSTLLLTLLMMVGLFFFIRASVKDRTQTIKLKSNQSRESTLEQVQQYFARRAYQIASVDEAAHQVVFEGFVRPSLFLAIFLTLLTAVGLLCLALILAILFPSLGVLLVGLVLLSPAAGVFYWKGAARTEKVLLQVEPVQASNGTSISLLTVVAHRDELAELQRSLPLIPSE
jgi:Flp pilus assembly protein TadB